MWITGVAALARRPGVSGQSLSTQTKSTSGVEVSPPRSRRAPRAPRETRPREISTRPCGHTPRAGCIDREGAGRTGVWRLPDAPSQRDGTGRGRRPQIPQPPPSPPPRRRPMHVNPIVYCRHSPLPMAIAVPWRAAADHAKWRDFGCKLCRGPRPSPVLPTLGGWGLPGVQDRRRRPSDRRPARCPSGVHAVMLAARGRSELEQRGCAPVPKRESPWRARLVNDGAHVERATGTPSISRSCLFAAPLVVVNPHARFIKKKKESRMEAELSGLRTPPGWYGPRLEFLRASSSGD
jgi:hypothetical protein